MIRFLELDGKKVIFYQFSSLGINGLSLTGLETKISWGTHKLAQISSRRKKKKFKKIVKKKKRVQENRQKAERVNEI